MSRPRVLRGRQLPLRDGAELQRLQRPAGLQQARVLRGRGLRGEHCSTAALQQMHCTHCDQAGYVCEAELCVEEGECDAERPCEAADAVCELPSYANCEYCDLEAKECKPGCEEDSNCPGDYYCSDHYCVTQE